LLSRDARSKLLKYDGFYLFLTIMFYICIYGNQYGNVFFTVLISIIYFSFLLLGFAPIWKFSKYDYVFVYSSKIGRIMAFSSITTIVISLVNVVSNYPSLSSAFSYALDPGKAYEYVKAVRRYSIDVSNFQLPSFVGIPLNCLTFTKYIVFIFLLLYWRQLSKSNRILGVTAAVVYIFQSFLIGAMINLGSILMAIFPVIIYYKSLKTEKRSMKYKIWMFLVFLITGITLAYFLGSRYIYIQKASFVLIVLAGFRGLLSYLSQGYVGFSFCLQLPFVCTWGQTTLYGLSKTILASSETSWLWKESYLMRSQNAFGWPALQSWSTIFPWLASDFSYFLIPFIMYFIGRFMCRVWYECIANKNPFSFLMMGMLEIFCFMIPANNQLFHSFGNAVGTVAIFILYLYSRRKLQKCDSKTYEKYEI